MTRFAVALALIVFGSTQANAALLGLTLSDTPDIAVGFLTISFDGATTSIDGVALTLDDDGVGPAEAIAGGTFNVTFNGVGTLTIGGTIASLGFNSGTLLTGTMTAGGAGSMMIDALFDVTGGDAAGLFGPVAAVKITHPDFDEGLFGAPFTLFMPTGGADVAPPIPEPASAGLFLLGLAVVGRAMRSRR